MILAVIAAQQEDITAMICVSFFFHHMSLWSLLILLTVFCNVGSYCFLLGLEATCKEDTTTEFKYKAVITDQVLPEEIMKVI